MPAWQAQKRPVNFKAVWLSPEPQGATRLVVLYFGLFRGKGGGWQDWRLLAADPQG